VIRIFISGLHSGPNPSPGVGCCRSLRAAFDGLELISVDYSVRASGLHWAEFNDVHVFPSWSELDFSVYRQEVQERLEGGHLWVSGLDLEGSLLSSMGLDRRGLLVATADALRAVSKPGMRVAAALGLEVPAWVPLSADHAEIASFGSEVGWPVWVKAPYYEAVQVHSWPELCFARATLENAWGSGGLYVQEHIAGNEESIALAALDGEVLGACHMKKRAVTTEGKTWSGEVRDLPSNIEKLLRAFVRDLRATVRGRSGMTAAGSGRVF